MRVTREQIEEARNTDLFEYLLENHEDDFKREPNALRLEDQKSVYIKRGSNLWIDWTTGLGGDAIDFLQKYYGYSFTDAVKELLDDGGDSRTIVHYKQNIQDEEPHEFIEPTQNPNGNKNVFAYMTKTRGIPADTVNTLVDAGLLYQDVNNNAVFMNYNRDRCEIVGTCTYGEKFKGTRCTYKDRFWYMGKTGDTVYITEGAIDAISLYELLGRKKAIYASLPGVGNQCIIDRIVNTGKYHVILAVDADEAGSIRRACNPQLEHLITQHCKDWNDELRAGYSLAG